MRHNIPIEIPTTATNVGEAVDLKKLDSAGAIYIWGNATAGVIQPQVSFAEDKTDAAAWDDLGSAITFTGDQNDLVAITADARYVRLKCTTNVTMGTPALQAEVTGFERYPS